jgi:AcrR family transcriptional regulator
MKKGDTMDLRIMKTKKNLYESLLYLMKEQVFETIKVADICQKAMINRSTFYAHFEDKYALLNSLILDLKEGLKEELEKNHKITNSKEYYLECLSLLLNHLEEHHDMYFPLILNNRNGIAMDMIYETVKEDIMGRMQMEHHSDFLPPSFIAHFYLGAILQVGIEWMQTKRYTKEQMLSYLDKLIPDNLNS